MLDLDNIRDRIKKWEPYLKRHPDDRYAQGICTTLRWVENELSLTEISEGEKK
jgi:hypothetical protein